MNKKIYALLIALSISASPVKASVSVYFSGMLTGTGVLLCLSALKKIREAKTTYELKDITSAQDLAVALVNGRCPEIIKHHYKDAYKEGFAKLSIGTLALLCSYVISTYSV